ncbi:zinc knuckle CX2CX4HX4C containing protein [Tanacetum coccineum]
MTNYSESLARCWDVTSPNKPKQIMLVGSYQGLIIFDTVLPHEAYQVCMQTSRSGLLPPLHSLGCEGRNPVLGVLSYRICRESALVYWHVEGVGAFVLSVVICFVYGSSKGYNEGEELQRSISSEMNKMTGKGDAGVSLPRTPVRGSQNPNLELDYTRVFEVPIIVHMDALHSEGSSWLINGTNVEKLFGVKFTSQSDIELFSMSIKEGNYSDILSMMYSADIDAAMNVIETIGKKFQVDVSKSSPLVSPSTTINVPHELNSIDVAATFKVPLSIVGDLHKLINDIEAGKHDELLSGMTNYDRMETLDALGSICNSILANRNNAYVIPCKLLHADDSINLNVDESTIPSDPIIQYVDINTKSTSYTRAAGTSENEQPKVNSNFRTLVADLIFKGVKKWLMDTRLLQEEFTRILIWVKLHDVPIQVFKEDGISPIATFIGKPVMLDSYTSSMYNETWGRSSFTQCLIEVNSEADLVDVVTIDFGHVHDYCPKKVMTPPIVTTFNVITPTIEKTNDGFQTVGKRRREKTTGNSSKKDNLSMSNSFSVLNDEEEDDKENVEIVHDESANLNTKAGGGSSFTAVAG